MNQCVLMMNQLELPPDFIHEPPKGYHYEVEPFRRNVCRICIVNDGTFTYTDVPPKSVWDSMMLKREGIQRLLTTPSKEIQ